MTGSELRQIRKRAGKTQRETATILGVHKMTVVHWEGGKVPISKPMSMLIECKLGNLTTEGSESKT